MTTPQTWVVYASTVVTLMLAGTQTLTASAAFSGTLRAALVPSTAAGAILDKYAGVWPAEGSITNQVGRLAIDY